MNDIQTAKRLNSMLDHIKNVLTNDQEARDTLTSINLLEQPIFAKAVAERIPKILKDTMPSINKFRAHKKDLAVKRAQRKKAAAKA